LSHLLTTTNRRFLVVICYHSLLVAIVKLWLQCKRRKHNNVTWLAYVTW